MKTPWETNLFSTVVHELGHAYMIESLGMEARRCVVEINPNHTPGHNYWTGYTTNRQVDQETPEQAILIDLAGALAEMLNIDRRISLFRVMLILPHNLNDSEQAEGWTDAHVRKALRLLRRVWPELLDEARTWSAELLITHPAPYSITG